MSKDIFEQFPGDWALIDVGAGSFIGRIISEDEKGIKLSPVFDYVNQLMRVPDGTPQGKVVRNINIIPHDICETYESVLTIKYPWSIMYFNEMTKEDKEQYASLVNRGVEALIEARAEKAGIKLANATQMPKGSPNKSIISM